MTTLLQAQLTDDLSDFEIPCSDAQVHELWQPSAKSVNTSGHSLHTTVPITTKLPGRIPLALCKKKPVIPPKPTAHHSLCSSKSVQSAMKVLFQDTNESSTDSDDPLFCESPALSPLAGCDDCTDGLSTTRYKDGERDIHKTIVGVEHMHQITQSLSKQIQNFHNTPTIMK